jgi:hypothetical protein
MGMAFRRVMRMPFVRHYIFGMSVGFGKRVGGGGEGKGRRYLVNDVL